MEVLIQDAYIVMTDDVRDGEPAPVYTICTDRDGAEAALKCAKSVNTVKPHIVHYRGPIMGFYLHGRLYFEMLGLTEV